MRVEIFNAIENIVFDLALALCSIGIWAFLTKHYAATVILIAGSGVIYWISPIVTLVVTNNLERKIQGN